MSPFQFIVDKTVAKESPTGEKWTTFFQTSAIITHCLCYFNSAINPIIYYFMSAQFKVISSCCHSKNWWIVLLVIVVAFWLVSMYQQYFLFLASSLIFHLLLTMQQSLDIICITTCKPNTKETPRFPSQIHLVITSGILNQKSNYRQHIEEFCHASAQLIVLKLIMNDIWPAEDKRSMEDVEIRNSKLNIPELALYMATGTKYVHFLIFYISAIFMSK